MATIAASSPPEIIDLTHHTSPSPSASPPTLSSHEQDPPPRHETQKMDKKLKQSIEYANPTQLRSAMIELCKLNPDVARLLEGLLPSPSRSGRSGSKKHTRNHFAEGSRVVKRHRTDSKNKIRKPLNSRAARKSAPSRPAAVPNDSDIEHAEMKRREKKREERRGKCKFCGEGCSVEESDGDDFGEEICMDMRNLRKRRQEKRDNPVACDAVLPENSKPKDAIPKPLGNRVARKSAPSVVARSIRMRELETEVGY